MTHKEKLAKIAAFRMRPKSEQCHVALQHWGTGKNGSRGCALWAQNLFFTNWRELVDQYVRDVWS